MFRLTFLLTLLFTLGASPATTPAPAEAAFVLSGCAHCHEMEGEDDWLHQINNDFLVTHECLTGTSGHYVHDCWNGDGDTWTYDKCNVDHEECSGGGGLGLLLDDALENLDIVAASDLAVLFPDNFDYRSGASWAFIKGCGQSVVAAVPVTTTP